MADAGIKFDVVTPNNVAVSGADGVQSFVDTVAAFASAHPGAVVSIEGQNEVNQFGTSLGGDTSLAAAAQIQQLLYTDVKANSVLSGISVYNLTLANDDAAAYQAVGDLSAYSDYANAHVYTGTASDIEQRYDATTALASAGSSGHAYVVTETGLTTLAGSTTLSVDDVAQAKMTLAELLLAYQKGSAQTFIFNLFDTPNSVDANATNNYFGLFNADGTPKLAATAVHNFTTLLSADNGAAMTGSFQVQGLAADGHSMNVAKSSGATDLILWREVSAWDHNSNTAATVSDDPVTVTFSSVQAHVYIYSPVAGSAPIASYENVSSITLNLTDTPLIVELGASTPLTTASVEAPSATMSLDAASFVAQIDTLSQMTGLSSITLTGDHVLQMSSVDTMKDVLKNYSGVLAKVDGGYSFNVELTGTGWRTETAYDQSGTLVSTATYTLSGTTPKALHIAYATGATDDYTYVDGVVTREVHLDADGGRTVTTYDANGNQTSILTVTADGVSTYSGQDAVTGDATSTQILYPDKSGDVYHYGVTGQSYTSDHYVYAAGGVLIELTRYHADGTLDYVGQYQSDGSKIVDNYDAAGNKTTETVTGADGSVSVTNYNIAGEATSRQDTGADGVTRNWNYDPVSGATTRLAVTNPDKSGDLYHYGVTGQSYVSDHYVYGAGGVMVGLTRYHADGTLDYSAQYNADGSKVVDNYSATGIRTTETTVGADGSNSVVNYNADGQATGRQDTATNGTTKIWTYDPASGATTRLAVTNSDKSGDLYHYGVTGQSYVSDHYVYAAGGAVQSLTRYHADGSLDYAAQYGTDGSSSVTSYNSAGQAVSRQDVSSGGVSTSWTYNPATGAVLSEAITNADKSGSLDHYGITGQSYVSDHTVYAAGGAVQNVTRYHADGSLDYYTQYNSDGSRVTDNYDANGHKLTEAVNGADGSRSTASYDLAGQMTSKVAYSATNVYSGYTYDPATGALTRLSITNPDKSGDLYHYGITGQSYVSDHYVYDVGGVMVGLTRYHADGTLDYSAQYNADGSKVVDNYSATGIKTLETAVGADGSTSVVNYNADGQATGRQDTAANGTTKIWTYDPASGATTRLAVTNSDKSGDLYHYGVTGQSYVSDHYVYAAGGAVQSLTRYHADGSLDYAAQYGADGSSSVTSYNSAGQAVSRQDVSSGGVSTSWTYNPATGAVLSEAITNADKSGSLDHYGITGQSYVSDHTVYAAGGAVQNVTRYHADGSLDYYTQYNSDGSRVTDNYDTTGHKLTETVNGADGSRSTASYDLAGQMTSKVAYSATNVYSGYTYDPATGALTRLSITNPDKSGDLYHYGITGQSYVSDHYVYDVGGVMVGLTRYHADGTLDYSAQYNADGSKVVDTYDATGHKLLEATSSASGSIAYHGYAEVSDQQTVTANLYAYTSATGSLSMAATPSVNIVDANGHVIKALDASAYTIKGGAFTLNAGAVSGELGLGTHAYVDVTYSVTDGSATAPVSMYSVQIDGTNPVVTIDAASFVSGAAQMAQLSDITTINLTGDHILSLSSVAAMQDMMANDAGLLAKIDGGYSFSIVQTGDGWKTDTLYDQSGTLVSAATYSLAGDVVTGQHVVAATGEVDDYSYADGVISKLAQHYANGGQLTTSYDSSGRTTATTGYSATGVYTGSDYDTGGTLVRSTTINPDKSGWLDHYGITGQSYVSDHYVYAAGGAVQSVTRYHADGSLDYYTQYNPDGSRVTDNYDATGHKLTDAINGADGSRSIASYNLAGQMTSKVAYSATGVYTASDYDASGTLARSTTINPDKSGWLDHHGITGQSYVSDHYIYAAGGAVQSVTRYHADGSLDYYTQYNPDGSRVTDNYDATGHKLTDTINGADGSRSIASYNLAGQMTSKVAYSATGVYTASDYDASGTLARSTTINPDKSGSLDHYGITGQSYVSDHYVYAAGGAVQSITRFHADGTRDYYTQYNADGSRTVDNYDAGGHLTLETAIAADGTRSTHAYVVTTDQQTVTTNLLTDASSSATSLSGSATVVQVDANGNVIKTLDPSDYSLNHGTLTLQANVVAGELALGTHAYVDVNYAVPTGGATAQQATLSIEIDGTLHALTGTAGADTFVASPGTSEIVTDFAVGQGDKIDLSRIDAISNNTAGAIDHFTFAGSSFTGTAGQLVVVKDAVNPDGNHWLVEGDTTGNGHADYLLHVTTTGGHMPAANDFILG